ncbi:MAG: NTPase [Solirubrobacteraceae bacterium]
MLFATGELPIMPFAGGESAAVRRLLIEARPGAGKTTALRRVAELLRGHELEVAGFLTEELRVGRRRVGFSVAALATGESRTLAHVDTSSSTRVGRYGVDLHGFERLALPELEARADVMLIDELGKMELASGAFLAAVQGLFDRETRIAATVHTFRDPFTDALKARSDVELVRLTRENRDTLPQWIAERVLQSR